MTSLTSSKTTFISPSNPLSVPMTIWTTSVYALKSHTLKNTRQSRVIPSRPPLNLTRICLSMNLLRSRIFSFFGLSAWPPAPPPPSLWCPPRPPPAFPRPPPPRGPPRGFLKRPRSMCLTIWRVSFQRLGMSLAQMVLFLPGTKLVTSVDGWSLQRINNLARLGETDKPTMRFRKGSQESTPGQAEIDTRMGATAVSRSQFSKLRAVNNLLLVRCLFGFSGAIPAIVIHRHVHLLGICLLSNVFPRRSFISSKMHKLSLTKYAEICFAGGCGQNGEWLCWRFKMPETTQRIKICASNCKWILLFATIYHHLKVYWFLGALVYKRVTTCNHMCSVSGPWSDESTIYSREHGPVLSGHQNSVEDRGWAGPEMRNPQSQGETAKVIVRSFYRERS